MRGGERGMGVVGFGEFGVGGGGPGERVEDSQWPITKMRKLPVELEHFMHFDKNHVKRLDKRAAFDIDICRKEGAMNIRKLTALTRMPERQIRYLIAEGFMPPPRGGRSNAEYGDDHVAAIRRYTRLRELGFPPAAIKLLLEGGQGVPFPVAPGITLVIDPDLLGSGADTGPLIDRLKTLLADQLLKDTSHENDCAANHR